jgi:hypothetical protein
VALAFGHGATLAMAVSAALSVAAFALIFALPTTADSNGAGPKRHSAARLLSVQSDRNSA